MSKQTRAQKKEEERRIIEEFENALAEERGANQTEPIETEEPKPQETPSREGKIYCRRCKAVMEKGVCPVCGYRIYMPMDDAKRQKIRIITASVCLIIFAIIWFLSK